MRLSSAVLLVTLTQLATAHPLDLLVRRQQRSGLVKRADVAELGGDTKLSQEQVEGIEALLNRTATRSWEIGTHLQAVLEFSFPSLSPFSSSSSTWTSPSPSVDPFPTQIVAAAASIVASRPSGQRQLIQDGSAADPASVGPFVLLSSLITENGTELGQGVSKEEAQEAVREQVEALLEGTPRTGDGAVSHRVEDVELWSDFVYMVPPFFAYLGVLQFNTTLLQAAYDQARLYRSYLRDESNGLWTHIYVPGGGGDEDGGLWATGNGWASAGMLRVLASIQNSGNDSLVQEFASQSNDLASWTSEIVEGCWRTSLRGGLLHNYLNEASTLPDAASTSLLVSSTYRLAHLSLLHPLLNSSMPSSSSLNAAETAYTTLVSSSHLSSSGVLSPVVNPLSYGDQLENVRGDGSGNVSPEGEAFVLLAEAARRDYLEAGGEAGEAVEVSGAPRKEVVGRSTLAAVFAVFALPLAGPQEHSNRMSLSTLSPFQRDTLSQFRSITARTEEQDEESVEVLSECGWNLEAAISRIFDGPPAASSSSSRHAYPPPAHDDNAGVDDALLPTTSYATSSPHRRQAVNGTGGLGTGQVGIYYLRQALAVPITILAWPAGLLYNLGAVLLSFLARLFRLRPSTASFRPRNPFTSLSRPKSILSPTAAAEAWIRSAESLTGLSCPSLPASSSSTASGVQIGSSSGLSRRGGAGQHEADGARLPPFFVGGYEAALRKARDERRVLMVVLSHEEHDADAAFKQDVLTNPELVKTLTEENVLVWGGDVSERDGYQVGQTLSFIALPFLAFISLQPFSAVPGNPSTASLTSPRMRLITRLEPSTTATANGPLTAALVHNHLLTVVLPKAKPFLTRLTAQHAQREADRREREATERRVQENARKDEERVLAVRRREAEKKAEEQRRAEEAERASLELAEKERVAGLARRWRVWKRGELEARGEPPKGEEGAVRCVVRLGDGRRVMRTFSAAEGTEDVYGWVECELSAAEDAEEKGGELPGGYEQKFVFRLATAFPRWVVPLEAAAGGLEEGRTSVGEAFKGQGGTVNLVVDGLEERRRLSTSSRDEDSEEEEEEEEEKD
ncbi:hypothetical protein JCM8547_007215 [Rhodosporidiobolus lusitaniae]